MREGGTDRDGEREGVYEEVRYKIPDQPSGVVSRNLKEVDSSRANQLDAESELTVEYESDKGYQQIAGRVVEIAEAYLNTQGEKKSPIRDKFVSFFTRLLFWQFAFILLIILLDSFKFIPFSISESVLTIFVISVFVETLSAIGVMIAFAFASKEESDIVGILTTVIQNYQKYYRPDSLNRKNNDQNKK